MSYCYHLLSIGQRPSTPLNDFSETPGPIFFKLHVEPCVKGGLKICRNGHGLLIKMATMPIYGKNPSYMVKTLKNLQSRESFWYKASWTQSIYQVEMMIIG